MFLATNAIYETRHSRQARPSTVAQMLDRIVRAGLIITIMSIIAACSGVPLIPGI